MHVRLSSIRGLSVVDDESQQVVAVLEEPLIHPDTGMIQGFFVYSFIPGESGELFLSCHDIAAWGLHVHIRSADRLSPPEDLVRITALLEDPRTFLGQRMKIDGTGKNLGTCLDVQFDTRHFHVEWLFPKRFFFWRQPVAASEVLEVTEEAILIRDPMGAVKEKEVTMPKVEGVVQTIKDVVPSPTPD